jgi:hypothetical protein
MHALPWKHASLLGLAGLTIVAVGASDARAAVASTTRATTALVPLPTRPTICVASPSVAQCESTAYHAACDVQSTCGALLTSTANAAAVKAQSTAAMSTLPFTPALREDGTVDWVRRVAYANAVHVNVAPFSPEGQAVPQWLAIEKSHPTLVTASVLQHPDWGTAGRQIQSCAEFTYDRHWDYDRFNDAAHALGGDDWSIYQLAMSTDPSLPGLDGRTLMQHGTGKTLDKQLGDSPFWRIETHWKNGFFATQGPQQYMLKEVYPASGGLPPDFPPDLVTALATPPRYDLPIGGEWAWHKTMAGSQWSETGYPAYSPINYTLANQRTAHLAQLIDQIRLAGMAEAMADYRVMYPTDPCPVKTKSGTCAMAVLNAYGTGALPVAGGFNWGKYNLPNPVASGFYTPSADVTDGTWLSTYTASHPGATNAANYVWGTEYDEASRVNDVAKIGARANRAKYEYLLAELMTEEWNSAGHGCFNPNSTLCDWSPHLFARSYMDYFKDDEAADFRACVQSTGDDFAAVRYDDAAECGGQKRQDYWFPPGWGLQRDYTWNADDVRTFTWFYSQRDALWANYAQQEATMAQSIASMPVDVAQGGFAATASDGGSFGDPATFSASFQYSASWNLLNNGTVTRGDVQTICALKGSLTSSFSATGGGLGKSGISILSGTYTASNDGTTASVGGSMVVLGKPIFNGDLSAPVSESAPFTLVEPIDSTPIANLPLADQWFLIGGVVPVHLQAFVAASASVTASASGSAGPCNTTDPNPVVDFHLNGQMTPSVRADLVAQAAVDAGVADAGVRVTLELVSLGMPYTTNIDVGYSASSNRTVTFSHGLGLDVDELAGDVELFADINYLIGSWHGSKSVFSWDGFHQHGPLWNPPATTFNLDALSYRLFGVPGTNGLAPTPPVCSTGGQ